MSHLLGAQDCVESLRRDVIDLQGSLAEVFSRTGPVRFRSWKFPDKNSCDLDLVQLLGHYDYIEGEEEFNQHSHSVLLELVIDRLMILLQSFNAYIEQVLGGQRAEDSGKAEGPVCVGPVVKHYWNNLIQFSSQQRKQRMNTAIRLETSPSSTHLDPQISSPTTSRRSATSRSPRTFRPSLVRCCSVSCQTVKLALVPCDACAEVQATLQSSAHAVASLCQALGLSCTRQSLLQSVGVTLQLGRLSACDLALWAREQQADMGRVQKHVIDVQEKVNSLTDALQKAEKEKEKLRVKLEKEEKKSMRDQEERRKREELQRRLQEEKEESTRRREEEWERLMEEQRHRRDEELKTQQEQLKQGTVVLELKISELKAELELQRKTLQCVESEKVSLVEDVHRLRLEEVRWKDMEEEKKDVEMKLSDTQKLLDKESAKYHSTQRQHELMGMKQRALVERVEALVQQVEELQSSLEECEEEKVKLADMLTHTTKERNTLQEQLTRQKSLNEDRAKQCVRLRDMDKSVSKLKEDLRQAEERERILVAFPELNPHKHTLPQSTGNVLCDMEQQLKGNSIRIRVLEQENATLNKTLSKLKQTQLKQMIRLADQSAGDQKLSPNSRSSEVGTEKIEKEKQIRKTSVSSSSSLHCQTLSLTIVPNTEGTYTNLRQATCTRSAGTNRRRK